MLAPSTSSTKKIFHVTDLNTNDEKAYRQTDDLEGGRLRISAVFPRTGQEKSNCIEKFFVLLSYIIVVLSFPLSLLTIFVLVRQFERVVILRNGKLRSNKVYGPGLIFYLPCVDSVKFTDLRIMCYDVRPQEALTKDSLTVSVDAVVYYKISDPIWAIIKVADYKQATQYIAATTLRNALGTRKLAEILVDRSAVSIQVFEHMSKLTNDWGVKVLRVEIKDIRLPLQLQKAMAAEAESSRMANAKIIVANAEIECAKNLLTATNMLVENPWGLQLRYMEGLQAIAGDNTHTIIIPFSVQTFRKMFK
ncbi:stomatin-4-like isoform X1 [Anticarsia gemmatalis]|uniref:stomatin-4-like isoform X1 n=1 Tax=Anticarsia gemmatalis TaxID=129554 RepID=UPI003F764045